MIKKNEDEKKSLSTEEFILYLGENDWNSSGTLEVLPVKLDLSLFLNLIDETPFQIVHSREGAFSIVEETGGSIDASRHTKRFDWHTDGLYLRKVPNFVILFCENVGQGKIPTTFSDTRLISKYLADPEHWETLKRLEMNFIHRNGEIFSRPMIESHSRTGEPIINLGSRVYIRPVIDVEKLNLVPSLREVVSAVNDLYQTLDTVTTLRHFWSPNDLTLFDNYSYVHGRDTYESDKNRKLVRIWLNC